MKASVIFKIFISTLVSFGFMSKYLFEQYSDMALAGRNFNYGIEAGVTDAFMYFIAAVLLGAIIWFVCMIGMSFIERLINKRSNEKRKARKEEEEGDVFHD